MGKKYKNIPFMPILPLRIIFIKFHQYLVCPVAKSKIVEIVLLLIFFFFGNQKKFQIKFLDKFIAEN